MKIILTSVCKKNFLIKTKKIFCTWFPKSAVKEGKTKFVIFFSYGHPQKNVG